MILTDAINLEAGARDFVYVCKKRPFAITCSPYFQKISETYIDLDLVIKMDIPIKNFQCTRITISGHPTRIVGQISQTVQCVVSGKLCGTSHLKAKVVRDLAKISNTDCIAGQQLFKKLMDPTVTVPSKVDKYEDQTTTSKGTVDVYTNISHVIANNAHEDETSSCDDEAMSESSHDAELLKFLSTQDELTRDEAFAQYPELTRLAKFFPSKNSTDQLQPCGISKDQAVPDSSRPACKSQVSRSAQACPELVQVPSPKPSQPVHQSLPTAAVISAEGDSTLAAIAASLPVGPTDAYIASHNPCSHSHNPRSHSAVEIAEEKPKATPEMKQPASVHRD